MLTLTRIERSNVQYTHEHFLSHDHFLSVLNSKGTDQTPPSPSSIFIISGGGQGGGNPGEWGREVGGKREETERDAGVM